MRTTTYKSETFLENFQAALATTAFVSSLGGIAALLRTSKKLSPRNYIAAAISSLVAGVIVFMLLHEIMSDHPVRLIGVSILAGIGGGNTTDLLLLILRKRAGVKDSE